MPLTNTLETARRIEALGFTHQQAQGFAELLEDTAHATQQDLKDFIREQMGAMEQRLEGKLSAMEGRINVRFAEQEARFEHSLRMQMATILTAIIGVVGLAVAIIKLFPNAH